MLDRDVAEVAEIDELILGGKAAALCVVVAGNSMLCHRLVLDVPVEIVRDAIPVLLKPQAHVRVEVLGLTHGVLAKAVWAEAHVAPVRVVRQAFRFPSGVGAEASESAVASVVIGPERAVDAA